MFLIRANEDSKDKIRRNSSKRSRRTSEAKTTLSQQIFPKGLAKVLLAIPMDPILNFLERADRELSENIYF